VGLAIEIPYPARIDPRRAARVYAALGFTHVYVEGLRPRSDAERDLVVATLVPDTHASVHFENGAMVLDALERVAIADGGNAMYTDVTFGNAHCRIWGDKAWIQIESLPPGGLEEAARIVEETTGLVAPPIAGRHEVSADRMVEFLSKVLAIYVRTPDREAAYALFRRFADPSKVFGWISAPSEAAMNHLPALIVATGGTVSAELFVDVETAADLTERVPCDGWQVGELLYTPETGLLWTFMTAPVEQSRVDAWIATIDEAFAKTT
jgi:hypothetical protein